MIPVITTCNGPAFSREPTRSPNLAAVAVVTAACATPRPGEGAAGREPSGHDPAVAGQRRAVGHLELRLPVPAAGAVPVTGV